MTTSLAILKTTLLTVAVISFCACNNSDKKSPEVKADTAKPVVAIDKRVEKTTPDNKPAIINIQDTIAPKRIVVYIKDSAATFNRIALKLGQIYGVKLAECFKKNAIKSTGQPMAWYITRKAPYFFEAGIPVNKKPSKLPPGVKVRELRADSVVIAGFGAAIQIGNRTCLNVSREK